MNETDKQIRDKFTNQYPRVAERNSRGYLLWLRENGERR